MNALVYLLQVSACTGVFYAFYYLLLNRLTFFTINRWYLVITLIASFIIPLLTIPVHQEYVPNIRQAIDVDVIRATPVATHLPNISITPLNPIDWMGDIKIVYLLAMVALAVRLLITIVIFFVNVKSKKRTTIDNIHIVKGNKKLTNGSFLNYIFLSDDGLSADEITQIIAHEMLHIKLYHSADRIMVRIMQVVLWVNPFIYFYGRSIEENHEFEVDREMGNASDKNKYADLLLHLSVAGQGMLYHSFSKVPLKRRITMLFTKPTNHMKKIIYLLILPVLMVSCLAFARLKTNRQFSAIDGVDDKSYSEEEIKTISRQKIESLTGQYGRGVSAVLRFKTTKQPGIIDTAKYQPKTKPIPVKQSGYNKTKVDLKTKMAKLIQPAPQAEISRDEPFFQRSPIEDNKGKYDKITYKLGDITHTTNIAPDLKIGAFIDGVFFKETELNTLSNSKIDALEPSRETLDVQKIPAGYYTQWSFKTIVVKDVATSLKLKGMTPEDNEELNRNFSHHPQFYNRVTIGEGSDYVICRIGGNLVKTSVKFNAKTGLLIDGVFYDGKAVIRTPNVTGENLELWPEGFDATKVPKDYIVAFTLRTKVKK